MKKVAIKQAFDKKALVDIKKFVVRDPSEKASCRFCQGSDFDGCI